MEKYVHIRIPELLNEKGISKTRLCKDLNLQDMLSHVIQTFP